MDQAGGPALEAGAHVGRYTILALADAGAMGSVYAAWDPELDRRVAVKLLPQGDAAAQDRLRREAQAMAKLSDGNVVAVYDVGTWQGGQFMVMELVEGKTLHVWLKEKSRRWRDVLAAFVQAGRGLAAAHRAGLVHRDFKSTNVLVRSDGRVAVTDFGLARSFGDDAADPSADVFAFCVALYEALWGTPPLSTESPEALIGGVRDGKLREPPPSPVPAHVRSAVLAGLAHDPAERPGSMDELLAKLDVKPRRARAVLFAAGVAVLATAAIATRHDAAHDCQGADASLAGIWDSSRRAAIHDAIVRTGVPGGEQLAATIAATFDRYGARWKAGWIDACQATRVRGTQTEAVMDARMLCLDDRVRTWKALGDVLVRVDAAMVEKAFDATSGLRSPEACADPRRLSLDPPSTDLGVRARAEALRRQLAEITVDVDLWRVEAATPRLKTALAEARALRSVSVEADVLFLSGRNLSGIEPDKALEFFHDAARAAERAGRDDLLAQARLRILYAVAFEQQQLDEALRWAEYARVVTDRLGDPDLSADLQRQLGTVYRERKQPKEALALHQQALDYYRRRGPVPSFEIANVLGDMSHDLGDLHRFDEALAVGREGVADFEQVKGRDHAITLLQTGDFADVIVAAGKPEEARWMIEDVIARKERLFGPDHFQLAWPLETLGDALTAVGRVQEAETAYRRALALEEKELKQDGPSFLLVRRGLAEVLVMQGRVDEALASARRALALVDEKDARRSGPLVTLAHVYEEMGRCADAVSAIEQARKVLRDAGSSEEAAALVTEVASCQIELGHGKDLLAEIDAALATARAQLPKDDIYLADHLVAASRLRLAAGKAGDAVAPAREAVEMLAARGAVGHRLVVARFALARALWEADQTERAHARELAKQALADAKPLVHTKQTIAHWIETH